MIATHVLYSLSYSVSPKLYSSVERCYINPLFHYSIIHYSQTRNDKE
jgi:hypothetical protein